MEDGARNMNVQVKSVVYVKIDYDLVQDLFERTVVQSVKGLEVPYKKWEH